MRLKPSHAAGTNDLVGAPDVFADQPDADHRHAQQEEHDAEQGEDTLGLCAEEEATHLYDTIAEYVSDGRVKKIMEDVAGEEQVHAGEFQKLLKVLEKDETELLEKGEDEAGEKMGDKSATWAKGVCKFSKA